MNTARKITSADQRAVYRPYPATPPTVAKTAVGLIENNPMVVLSGTRQPFADNRQIGKTLACREIGARLRGAGKRISYADIKRMLRVDTTRFSYIHVEDFRYHLVDNLAPSEIYIFDEIHHAFPRDPQSKMRDVWELPIYRGEEYNDAMFAFWEKIGRLKMEGRRFLMVTALHPQDAEYQEYLFAPPIQAFFSAPIVELAFSHPRA